jgi:hypothetical protein
LCHALAKTRPAIVESFAPKQDATIITKVGASRAALETRLEHPGG